MTAAARQMLGAESQNFACGCKPHCDFHNRNNSSDSARIISCAMPPGFDRSVRALVPRRSSVFAALCAHVALLRPARNVCLLTFGDARRYAAGCQATNST
jgi:hypothetical protein